MLKSNFPMRISIGADHAGFLLKESLRQKLVADGHTVTDRGADSELSCDYPVFAAAVARDVSLGASDRGILICGSGVGAADRGQQDRRCPSRARYIGRPGTSDAWAQ